MHVIIPSPAKIILPFMAEKQCQIKRIANDGFVFTKECRAATFNSLNFDSIYFKDVYILFREVLA